MLHNINAFPDFGYFGNFRYGDKTPRTVIGRLFGGVWIFVGILVSGLVTASITTALGTHEDNINSPNQLRGLKVRFIFMSIKPLQIYLNY